MTEAIAAGLDLYASDASGQRKFTIRNFARNAKVRDLINVLVPRMGLSANDSAGRPMDYQVFAKREAYHLRGSETVGDVLETGDEVSLLADIQAG